jgi:hypothetical protein
MKLKFEIRVTKMIYQKLCELLHEYRVYSFSRLIELLIKEHDKK